MSDHKFMTCPPPERLSGYLLGTLLEDSAESVAAHLVECETCETTVTSLEPVRDPLLEKLRKPRPFDGYADEDACRRAVARIQHVEKTEGGFEKTLAPDCTTAIEQGTIRVYQLLEKLGEGGMGTVYKARHVELDKVVALKVLPTDKLRDEASVQRFKREMKAVGRLEHQHIIRAMDAGEENGLHYLVMEYAPGIDLAELIRRRGPLRVADACELVRQAALGLQEAHENGMVHRDIKPSNLFLASQGNRPPLVKVLDLGLALFDHLPQLEPTSQPSSSSDLTDWGQMVGTLSYMAPEQSSNSHAVDIRADIYSLGATLHKLLTGEPPFSPSQYNTPLLLLSALIHENAPTVALRRPELPPGVVAIVDRMLAKAPADRFATPKQVADALEPFCAGADFAALLDDSPSFDPSSATATVKMEAGTRKPRHARSLFAAAALAAVLLLGVLFTLQTDTGTITVVSPDGPLPDDVKVVLLAGGKQIEITARDHWKMTVAPGEYGVEIHGGDDRFTVAGENITVSRGGKKLLNITRKPNTVVEEKPTAVEISEPLSRGDWKRGPTSGSLPGLLEAPTPLPGIKWQLLTATPDLSPDALAWSPDGKELAGSDSSHVRLYRFENGTLRLSSAFPAAKPTVAWSPDGRRLAAVAPGDWMSLRLWNNTTKTFQDYLIGHVMDSASWSPDGETIALWDRGTYTVSLFDATRLVVRATLTAAKKEGFVGAAWHPLNKQLTTVQGNGQVVLWDVSNRKEIQRFPSKLTNAGKNISAAWDPTGKYLAVVSGEEVHLFDAEGKLLGKANGSPWARQDGLNGCQWTADGKRLLAAYRIFDVSDLSNPKECGVWKGGTASFVLSPDGKHLATDGGKSYRCQYISVVNLADVLTGKSNQQQSVCETPDYGFRLTAALSWSRDEGLCCVGDEDSLAVWDAQRQTVQHLPALRRSRWGSPCWYTGFSADSRYLAAWFSSQKRNLLLWRSEVGKYAKSHVLKHDEDLKGAEWAPRGETVATRMEKVVYLWDAATGQRTNQLVGHTDTILGMAWKPDGKQLVTASLDKTIRVWDAESGMPVREPIRLEHAPQCVSLSHGGDRLAVFDTSGAVEVRRLKDGERLWRTPDLAPSWQQQIVWTGDDKAVLTLFSAKKEEGSHYGLLDAADGKLQWKRKTQMGHNSTHFRLSPTERSLLQCSWDAGLIDFASGERITRLKIARGEFSSRESGLATLERDEHGFTLRDPQKAHVRWIGVNLPAAQYAAFSAAGKPLMLTSKAAEHLAYLVQHTDTGRCEVLSHGEFTRRYAGKATPAP